MAGDQGSHQTVPEPGHGLGQGLDTTVAGQGGTVGDLEDAGGQGRILANGRGDALDAGVRIREQATDGEQVIGRRGEDQAFLTDRGLDVLEQRGGIGTQDDFLRSGLAGIIPVHPKVEHDPDADNRTRREGAAGDAKWPC